MCWFVPQLFCAFALLSHCYRMRALKAFRDQSTLCRHQPMPPCKPIKKDQEAAKQVLTEEEVLAQVETLLHQSRKFRSMLGGLQKDIDSQKSPRCSTSLPPCSRNPSGSRVPLPRCQCCGVHKGSGTLWKERDSRPQGGICRPCHWAQSSLRATAKAKWSQREMFLQVLRRRSRHHSRPPRSPAEVQYDIQPEV